jgi:hypothetical protein
MANDELKQHIKSIRSFSVSESSWPSYHNDFNIQIGEWMVECSFHTNKPLNSGRYTIERKSFEISFENFVNEIFALDIIDIQEEIKLEDSDITKFKFDGYSCGLSITLNDGSPLKVRVSSEKFQNLKDIVKKYFIPSVYEW